MATIVKHPPSKNNKLDTLKDFITNNKDKTFNDRIDFFTKFLQGINSDCQHTYGRLILSEADREVTIKDPFNGQIRKMLMFASNNYLGFACHPYIKMKVKEAIDRYGVGIGGPPLLNGYSKLMHELEDRLASLKHKESAMIFPAGYSANVGILTALAKTTDLVIYDELSHASFLDGIRMAHVGSESFEHNNIKNMYDIIQGNRNKHKNIFLGIEGVYSMDGDIAPLDKIIPFCKKHKIITILDDAHGTGILGDHGGGTAEYFKCGKEIDVSMGTFSKVFAVSGGFVAANHAIIEYIKYFARSFMFSASLPPVTLAAVLAGLDLIEKQPVLREHLLYNVRYAIKKFRNMEYCHPPEAAIISIRIPDWIHIRKLNYLLHQKGLFINAIEYPAVPKDKQRLRISIMTSHTEKDLDYLAECLEDAFQNEACFI
jgi:glycine C-acetyltransferase